MAIKALLPWALIGSLFWFFYKLCLWAKKKRTGALALGALAQATLPDPRVQQTIQIVNERETVKKNQEGNAAPPEGSS
ncbi:hypothetical protein [Permianibacter aggregans]|uniref:Uncharacterized protein n=1 Tax=Permianibacter aggregans TaxID=1510150 RepID=A0A4V3D705_9GAMM|nr:hypothetical protein [Permianibacter aggregans]QGX39824.1 hypothetical protein E2H98_09205 [Permianibacter aggregans]TDQ45917.1 hypothetical protein EV696_11620 [Permianibacter aggregans]